MAARRDVDAAVVEVDPGGDTPQHIAEVAGIVADPALCSYLLDAGQDHSLDGLVEKHLPPDYPKLLSREALCRAGGKHGVPFDQVDIAAAADFAIAQARATYLLSALLWPPQPLPIFEPTWAKTWATSGRLRNRVVTDCTVRSMSATVAPGGPWTFR